MKGCRYAENRIAVIINLHYSYENTPTSVRMAESALNKGHAVNLVESTDGVYCFLFKQKAKGIVNAEGEFSRLVQKKMKVYL